MECKQMPPRVFVTNTLGSEAQAKELVLDPVGNQAFCTKSEDFGKSSQTSSG